MFSADITWTPVAEVESTRHHDPPSSPATDRFDAGSVRSASSANPRNLSLFRWARGKKAPTPTPTPTPTTPLPNPTYIGDDVQKIGSVPLISQRTRKWTPDAKHSTASVAELPEDWGPERYELPGGNLTSSFVPDDKNLASQSHHTHTQPLAHLPYRYYSPNNVGIIALPSPPSEYNQPVQTSWQTPGISPSSSSAGWAPSRDHPEESSISRKPAVAANQANHYSNTDIPPVTNLTHMHPHPTSEIISPSSIYVPNPTSQVNTHTYPPSAKGYSTSIPTDNVSSTQPQGYKGAKERTLIQPSALESLVRRMSKASATTRLNRVTEEWIEPLNAGDKQEIALEKELWLLAELLLRGNAADRLPSTSTPITRPLRAVQRPHYSSSNPESSPRVVRILDVASSAADLVQLAVLQPGAEITHLSFRDVGIPAPSFPPPTPNITMTSAMLGDITMPKGQGLSLLAAAGASFDHIRLTPAIIGLASPPQLKALIHECSRVLDDQGCLLEINLVDPVPVLAQGISGDLGPATTRWVESDLLVALDSEFRCTRPGVMVPLWMRNAGLGVMEDDKGLANGDKAGNGDNSSNGNGSDTGSLTHELRVCVDERGAAGERLEAELCRFLLRSQYPFVKTWLWEKEQCRAECLERGTRFRVVTRLGFKFRRT